MGVGGGRGCNASFTGDFGEQACVLLSGDCFYSVVLFSPSCQTCHTKPRLIHR